MNKLWRRTARHKNSNQAGKHSTRLNAGSGNWFIYVIIIIVLLMSCGD